MSNNRDVLTSIPSDEKAPAVAALEFDDDLPYEKTLGLQWHIQTDCTFNVKATSKAATRRGLLSVKISLYNPLGIVAHVILIPKLLMQRLCRDGLSWDQRISPTAEDQ